MKGERNAGQKILIRVSAAAGSIWHTLLAFGANFDYDGLYNFRGLSWPATFTGTSLQSLADAEFYCCGSLDAYKDMFRTGGKTWATLRDLTAAHAHFKEIKGTGVLGIFPFGHESTTLKVPTVVQAKFISLFHDKGGYLHSWCLRQTQIVHASSTSTQLARQMTACQLMALIVRPGVGPIQPLLKGTNAHSYMQ